MCIDRRMYVRVHIHMHVCVYMYVYIQLVGTRPEMFMVTTSVTVDTRGQGAIYISHPRVTRELRGYPRVCHE